MDFLFLHTLTYWHWITIGAILLIAEVLVNGGFLLWIGISAFIISLIVWIKPALVWSSQWLLFGMMALIVCVVWRLYTKRYPEVTDNPKLNQRCEQYVGRTFELIEGIQNARGKIRVDGIVWTVKGPDLPTGTIVKVIHTSGTILIVQKY